LTKSEFVFSFFAVKRYTKYVTVILGYKAYSTLFIDIITINTLFFKRL